MWMFKWSSTSWCRLEKSEKFYNNIISLCLFFLKQANQIKPVLVHRSTSPLIKEVYVKSSNSQTAQTDVSSFAEELEKIEVI